MFKSSTLIDSDKNREPVPFTAPLRSVGRCTIPSNIAVGNKLAGDGDGGGHGQTWCLCGSFPARRPLYSPSFCAIQEAVKTLSPFLPLPFFTPKPQFRSSIS